MKKLIVLSLTLILLSCKLMKDEKPINLYYKEIKTPDLKIEWYFHSLISNTTPDYIIANSADTLCISHNIADIYLKQDTINITFYGTPQSSIPIKTEVGNQIIKVDTISRDNYKTVKPFYKKESIR